jgi:hypothetical protein
MTIEMSNYPRPNSLSSLALTGYQMLSQISLCAFVQMLPYIHTPQDAYQKGQEKIPKHALCRNAIVEND